MGTRDELEERRWESEAVAGSQPPPFPLTRFDDDTRDLPQGVLCRSGLRAVWGGLTQGVQRRPGP